MDIPKDHETFIPILEVLSDKGPLHYKELRRRVRDKYYSNLPAELLNQTLSTGTNKLLNRINWGKSYLKIGKFLKQAERGIVEITDKGKKVLKSGEFTMQDLKNDPDYIEHLKNRKKGNLGKDTLPTKGSNPEGETPQDLIDRGISDIETQVKDDLLDKLKKIDPYEFERVILKLMKGMGYGEYEETKKSHDGGIDGIVNQDKLGLEKIYMQAKCYSENKICETAIRNFIGAMSGDTNKGVFVTTSSFNKAAVKKANDAHHKIILIDGNKLVDLMYQHGVGVQVSSAYEIKTIDEDFFEGG